MKLSLTILTAGLLALSASTSVLASPVSDSSDIVAERSTVLEERVQMAEPLEARRKHHKKRSGGKGKATWYAGAQVSFVAEHKIRVKELMTDTTPFLVAL